MLESNCEVSGVRIERLTPGAPERLRRKSLLDEAFSVPAGSSFFDDFPVWAGSAVTWAAFDGEKLVSSVSVRTAYVKTLRTPLKIALIGAVATAKSHQGQGLASQLVEQASLWAREQGAGLIALWGSEHSMYRRLGFELAGSQGRTPLSSIELPHAAALNGIGRGWVPGLFPRLQARREGLVLQSSDEAWISAHKNVEWFWIGSPQKPIAYAALGRGIDLGGIVHEWDGPADAVRDLMAAVLARRPDASVIGSPELLDSYELLSDATVAEYLALVRVLDPKAVLDAYSRELEQLLRFSPAVRPGSWEISVGGKKSFDFTDAQLSQALLGPATDLWGPLLSPAFPLPFWLWGLDAC